MKRMRMTVLWAAGALLVPVIAFAQVSEVRARVDGLSCPFCAYGLEKHLKKVEGVSEPVIDVKEGTVTMVPIAGTLVDYRAVWQAVEKAGFTPREVRVAGRARVALREGETVLLDAKDRVLFVIEAAKDDLRPGSEPIAFAGTYVPPEKDDRKESRPRLRLLPAGAEGWDDPPTDGS